MPLTHLQVIAVPVSDPQRARTFYQDVLDFELIADMPMGPDQRSTIAYPAPSPSGSFMDISCHVSRVEDVVWV